MSIDAQVPFLHNGPTSDLHVGDHVSVDGVDCIVTAEPVEMYDGKWSVEISSALMVSEINALYATVQGGTSE